ncbi:hypothetical protein RTBOTA2_006065 [Rhodotorula toruloides]|nr:hypothetical protein RTBOTA2_006065 [Rhodotorula toruloides]
MALRGTAERRTSQRGPIERRAADGELTVARWWAEEKERDLPLEPVQLTAAKAWRCCWLDKALSPGDLPLVVPHLLQILVPRPEEDAPLLADLRQLLALRPHLVQLPSLQILLIEVAVFERVCHFEDAQLVEARRHSERVEEVLEVVVRKELREAESMVENELSISFWSLSSTSSASSSSDHSSSLSYFVIRPSSQPIDVDSRISR